MEKIGKVLIDLSSYGGKDLYSDGVIEKELLNIVKQYDKNEYDRIIYESGKGELLYYLSSIRGNVISWMNDDKNARVLEIGSGCGAVTGVLAKKYGYITCIEVSKQRALINAYRNNERENIEIKVGNYNDILGNLTQKYDIITLIDDFRNIGAFFKGSNPYVELLSILKGLLAPNGVIVIATENKFGLKYWAGCAEDSKGIIYGTIEEDIQLSGVRAFSKLGLEKVIEDSNCYIENFYYPYPDHKLPFVIYSDDRLPKEGELNNNFNNFDFERVATFDESKVFDCLIREKQFCNYANSFLITVKCKED